MIRATTGGVLRSYRKNLMSSFITDNKARETVLTQRVFNSYAEDPAAAAKAFRLRKSRMQTSSQLRVCDDTYHKYQSAFQCLQTVSELIDTENSSSDISTLKSTTLRMLNDPEGDARTQLNKVLDNLSDTIIQQMNQTYGDEFIFAGADGHNVPFTVEEVDGQKKLYYRGVSVDAAEPALMKGDDGNAIQLNDADKSYVLASAGTTEMLTNTTPVISEGGDTFYVLNDADTPLTAAEYNALDTAVQTGYTKMKDGTYYKKEDLTAQSDYDDMVANKVLKDGTNQPITVTKDGKTYYIMNDADGLITEEDYNAAKLEADKLKYLANEKRLVDIGLGFQEDGAGKIIESSAFNESLPGLQFLGYGLDENGDPKNIYSIVQRLKEIADGVPVEGQWDDATYDEFDRLVGKLEDAASEYKTQFTNQSAGTEKLKNCYDLLEDNVYNLKEQYSNLEDVNMADAITSFIWAEYCYNAALKVGNSILSQSLMDYLQ